METYLFYTSNNDDLKKSSSGGAFSCIAKYILSIGGIVYGAAIDQNTGLPFHMRVDNVLSLPRLFGSKYCSSELGGCFSLIKKDLLDDKYVLFVGSPCQVNSLYNYVKKELLRVKLTKDISHFNNIKKDILVSKLIGNCK